MPDTPTTNPLDPHHDAPPPRLPIELLEPILTCCVHLAAVASLWHMDAMARPLYALSRSDAPLVTKAVLMRHPHLNLNVATESGDTNLLDVMLQWSKQPKGRPIVYDPIIIVPLAMQRGFVHVLDWWWDKSGLVVDWNWTDDQLTRVLCGPEGLTWLEWWRARGFPHVDQPLLFPYFLRDVSRAGRVDVLDWLLQHVGGERMVPETDQASVIREAALGGHPQVLDWWVDKIESGAIPHKMPALRLVFSEAVLNNHVAALEWCKKHPAMMQILRDERKNNIRPQWYWETVLPSAVQYGLEAWFDTFDLIPYEFERTAAAVTACKVGSLSALKWMHRKGYLRVSRAQLLQASIRADKLDMLDWIRETIDPHIPHAIVGPFYSYRGDLFHEACETGSARILDWLIANGYECPPHNDKEERPCDKPSPFAELLLAAASHGHIQVLDWLLNHIGSDFSCLGKQMLNLCFLSASSKGFIDVLDWLVDHAMSADTVASMGQVDTYIVREVLEKALEGGRIAVLNWWSDKLLETNWSQTKPMPYLNDGYDCNILDNAFSHGRVDVVYWWLHRSGPFQGLFGTSFGQLYVAACQNNYDAVNSMAELEAKNAAQLAVLHAWYDAGQPIEYADTIHYASVSGRVDILDWLLKSTRATERDFERAWAGSGFQMGPDAARDRANHGWSLLWWVANLPHVCCTQRANRGPYANPIHAHIHQHMLKSAAYSLETAFRATHVGCGDVAMLAFLKDHTGSDWILSDSNECLKAASFRGFCHVLEWWKAELGVDMYCPDEIVQGTVQVHRRAMQWWTTSGLVDSQQLSRIKVAV